MSEKLEGREKLDTLFKTRIEDAPITELVIEARSSKTKHLVSFEVFELTKPLRFELSEGNKTLTIYVEHQG